MLHPNRHLLAVLLLALTLTARLTSSAHAGGQASVAVSAAPDVIYADGKSTTVITATVRDGGGKIAPDGTSVRFTTTLGTLTPDTATTASGVARVSLTAPSQEGKASVTAAAFGVSPDGSSAGGATVEFTADRESLFDKDARWIRIDCPQYLIYSADTRIVEAEGKNGSAHLSYKSIQIDADRLQADLQTQTILAHGAVIRRGHHQIRAAELRYDLLTGSGSAILADQSASVLITGADLETSPQVADPAELPLQSNPFRFVDLSDSRVVVAARAITADPGDQVQFRRATIYSDGKKLLSVPYHVMPMNSNQVFGQQLLGFGSQGVFLNLPYYYSVTPHSKGTIYLRNAAVSGANVGGALSTGNGFFTGHAARHGLALDLEQTYQMGRGGQGQFLLSGITRSEWGAQWSHTQRLDEATTSYLFVDYPSHRSLYASSNVSRQFNGFSFNLNAAGSRDPGYDGYSAQSLSLNAYIQSNPRALGHSGVNYTTDFAVQTGTLTSEAPGTGKVTTPINTKSVDFRLFTAPQHLDKRTVVTDSLTVGQAWGGQRNHFAPTLSASLGLTRTFRQSDSLALNYTYRYDPLLTQIGTPAAGLDSLSALLRSPSQHRLTVTYQATPLKRVQTSFSGGYGLPLNDRSLFASATYRVTPDWGLGLATTYENYLDDHYSDVEYSITRRVLGRDLVFYYSNRAKKIRFDFAGTGWQ